MNGVDQMLTTLVIMLLTLMLIGLLMKKFKQPYFSAYIIAGLILGPQCLRVFTKPDTIAGIGELGLLIQMFFIGMHLELRKIVRNIRKPLLGVCTQLVLALSLFTLLVLFIHGPLKISFYLVLSSASAALLLYWNIYRKIRRWIHR